MYPAKTTRRGLLPKDNGMYTDREIRRTEILGAFQNCRRFHHNTYRDLMTLASKLYTCITGAFPLPGTRKKVRSV